jgi:single-strand DNA-binding protein
MSKGVNCVFLSGNLTKDPEVRDAGSSRVARFTLAVSNEYTNKQGEKKGETSFIPCEVWDSGADVMEKNITKGDELFVEGTWRVDEWEKDGDRRRMDKVRVASFKILRCKKWTESKGSETSQPVDQGVAVNAPADGADIPF